MTSVRSKEQKGVIPKVLMVSSAAFGVFSAVNPYVAIPGAITELAANLTNDQNSIDRSADLNSELISML